MFCETAFRLLPGAFRIPRRYQHFQFPAIMFSGLQVFHVCITIYAIHFSCLLFHSAIYLSCSSSASGSGGIDAHSAQLNRTTMIISAIPTISILLPTPFRFPGCLMVSFPQNIWRIQLRPL